MATKRGFRVRPSNPNARSLGVKPRRGRVAFTLAAATAACLLAASPALADTGSVYFDSSGNAAAGGAFFTLIFEGGARNVGLGATVFPSVSTGNDNIAVGDRALFNNSTGNDNIAVGTNTLSTIGSHANSNIAIGSQSLVSDTNGDENTALGTFTLPANTSGDDNTATGEGAMGRNTSGSQGVATGAGALSNNTTGGANTAIGDDALVNNSTGDQNVALGSQAGSNLTTGNDNIDIGNQGKNGEAGTIRIGDNDQTAAFLAGVNGTSLNGPTQRVLINANGQLGTAKAASGKPSAKAASADRTVSRLQAEVEALRRKASGFKRLQREVNQLRAEVKQGR
jgi:hypothetical protein